MDLTTLSACVANASGPENEELAKLWFENYHATAHCRSCYHDVASALLVRQQTFVSMNFDLTLVGRLFPEEGSLLTNLVR